MSDWLHELPIVWIAVVVFALVAALVAIVWFVVVVRLARRHAAALQAVSGSMLPPLGIVFALIVGFLAASVWGDSDDARDAVSSEASALRAIVLLSAQLPDDTATEMRGLVRQQIQDAVTHEWPAMQKQDATIAAIPVSLAKAQDLALQFEPQTAGQTEAQKEIGSRIGQALDARRQRIIVSDSRVNAVKWFALFGLSLVMLVAIACVHSGNRRAALLAMALFGVAAAVVFTMLVAQDEPFTGHLGESPALLEEASPPT
jgi:hypothetical protein